MSTAIITRDFNGHAFTFRDDGWFNMTKAAKHFGKHMDYIWRNKGASEYMAALSAASNPAGSREYRVATAGRGGGTWAHPKPAVFFARWLDVRFAVWCDAMIDDILKVHAQVTITKPKESAVMALPQDYEGALSELTGGQALPRENAQ